MLTDRRSQLSITMRDRLSHLHAFSEPNGDVKKLGNFETSTPHYETPAKEPSTTPEMEVVLDEACDIRRNIKVIHLDVKRLKNSCIRSELPNAATVKQDSNSIAADIKARAEDTLGCLRKMDAHAKELEKKHGINGAVSRIARTQYGALSTSFRDVMTEYNDVEMSQREYCSAHIQRQMVIVGKEVTVEQIEEMLENGKWNVFSENLVTEGRTARSALDQIESRHTELLDLERRIRSIHEVFLDMAMLVEEQNSMIDYIHTNVQKTDAEMKGVLLKLNRAKAHDRSNPFKKLFIWRR